MNTYFSQLSIWAGPYILTRDQGFQNHLALFIKWATPSIASVTLALSLASHPPPQTMEMDPSSTSQFVQKFVSLCLFRFVSFWFLLSPLLSASRDQSTLGGLVLGAQNELRAAGAQLKDLAAVSSAIGSSALRRTQICTEQSSGALPVGLILASRLAPHIVPMHAATRFVAFEAVDRSGFALQPCKVDWRAWPLKFACGISDRAVDFFLTRVVPIVQAILQSSADLQYHKQCCLQTK